MADSGRYIVKMKRYVDFPMSTEPIRPDLKIPCGGKTMKISIENYYLKRRAHCTRCDRLLMKADMALLIKCWSGVGFFICNDCAPIFSEEVAVCTKTLKEWWS